GARGSGCARHPSGRGGREKCPVRGGRDVPGAGRRAGLDRRRALHDDRRRCQQRWIGLASRVNRRQSLGCDRPRRRRRPQACRRGDAEMTAVLVTRPGGENDPLVAALHARGYRVSAVPTVLTRAVSVEWPDLARYDWVIVTSATGVATLPGALAGPRWAAVGESTASALRAKGVSADIVPAEANGAALAKALPDPAGARVLLVRASLADPDLPAGLRGRGALVEEITAYETVEGPAESAEDLRQALQQADLAAVVFASGSAVRGFMKLGGPTNIPAVTIGPHTSAVARDSGFNRV